MAVAKSWLGRAARAALWIVLTCIFVSTITVLLFRWVDPPYSAFMAETQIAAWKNHDSSYVPRHTWANLERISPNLPLAVVASEDQKFPDHRGFDVEAIEKAYAMNQHRHRLHGASTISQQVAKNLFLWSGRSYFRKALEAYFTVLIEVLWPKERILEMYLNIAQFGDGIYGVQAATERFWHKPATHLSSAEAALLAAVLPNPLRLHAERPSHYVLERRDWILGQMRDLGGAAYLHALDRERGAAH